MAERIVVYPGSFNPITNGHTDLVERPDPFRPCGLSNRHFCSKRSCCRAEGPHGALCREVLEPFGDRVSVDGFNSLLVDYVRSKGTRFVLRGLRTVTDFDYEFQMAEMNRSLDPQLEYVFLPTSRDCSFISLPCKRNFRFGWGHLPVRAPCGNCRVRQGLGGPILSKRAFSSRRTSDMRGSKTVLRCPSV